MPDRSTNDVTRILHALERGEARAVDELLPLVYDELRLLAFQKLSREPPGQTLQATALVHEVYLRLIGDEGRNWSGRGQFLAAAAEAMRRILIDNARRKKSLKRGGDQERVNLDDIVVMDERGMAVDDLLALDEALDHLSQVDSKVADLVKLRFFGGLTGQQAAQALGISHNTADAYWAYARAWLRVALDKGPDALPG
jgi:RNA polymerase sigma factor (TIGR02999 family)